MTTMALRDGATARDEATSCRPKVGLIWGEADSGVIGLHGGLPWDLPEDMAHFARTTRDATVIMGRKTWESLPERFRPLPGRKNIVLTRSGDFIASGATVVSTVEEALAEANGERCWVMGGSSIYREFAPHADLAIVTEIQTTCAGDAYAPNLDEFWLDGLNSQVECDWAVSKTNLSYRILRQIRNFSTHTHPQLSRPT